MRDQEVALCNAGVSLDESLRDCLTQVEIEQRALGILKLRDELLHATCQFGQETIYVASLMVLGWTIPDIACALVAAGRRNANVCVIDIGKTFSAQILDPDVPMDGYLLAALARADKAWLRGVVTGTRSAIG